MSGQRDWLSEAEREALAEWLIDHRDRDYAASVYKFTPRKMAADILASDWLAERDQKMQATGALNVIAHGPQHPDMETYARIHNEGWDAAMLAQVAPDPTTADDWLARREAAAAAEAVEKAAETIESYRRQSPMNGDGSNYTIDQILVHLVGSEERDRLKREHQERWNQEYLDFHARGREEAGT